MAEETIDFEAPIRDGRSKPFIPRYTALCAGCDTDIHGLDHYSRAEADWMVLVKAEGAVPIPYHEDCTSPDDVVLAPSGAPCPSCFMMTPPTRMTDSGICTDCEE